MRVHEYGGPEVFRAEEVPEPAPADGEVVVQLRASALNWHDVLVRVLAVDCRCRAPWAWMVPESDATPVRKS